MASFLRLPKPFETGLAVIVVGATLFVLFRILASPAVPISQDVANGTYANPQGVTLYLRDGQLSTGKQRAAYQIERDKQGTYVALEHELLEQPNGDIRIGSRRDTMKSYLDKREHPSRIIFWVRPQAPADALPSAYVFHRLPEAY